jgi:hypothetical protein
MRLGNPLVDIEISKNATFEQAIALKMKHMHCRNRRKPESHRNEQFTKRQRVQIVKYFEENPGMTYARVSEWAKTEFRLSWQTNPSTIGRIIRAKSVLKDLAPQDEEIRRTRYIEHPQLDIALANWVLQMQYQKLRINGELIKAKASQFAEALDVNENEIPKFSNGWLYSFQMRHGFSKFQIHGESGDAEMNNIEEALNQLKDRIKDYNRSDIYNMDETALFYNLAPDTTIARQQIEGSKKDKTRITIALTCNADGTDKLPPLFIGHAGKPRCFNKKSGEELGFFYLHNKKAWMTGLFFQEFLKRFNDHVNRKVLLLVDNAPSHIWKDLNLPNVEILSLPKNTTSKLQPLDAGIIASFKRYYRRCQLEYALDLLDAGRNPYKVDQLTAMKWVRGAWSKVSQLAIINCWNHTSLMPAESESGVDRQVLDSEATAFEEQLEKLVEALNIEEPMSAEDYIMCAEEEIVHQVLTDEELLAAAVQIDDEEDGDEEVVDSFPLISGLSGEECLKILAQARQIIESKAGNRNVEDTVSLLRHLQNDIRWEVTRKKSKNQMQKRIHAFFRPI